MHCIFIEYNEITFGLIVGAMKCFVQLPVGHMARLSTLFDLDRATLMSSMEQSMATFSLHLFYYALPLTHISRAIISTFTMSYVLPKCFILSLSLSFTFTTRSNNNQFVVRKQRIIVDIVRLRRFHSLTKMFRFWFDTHFRSACNHATEN